MAHVYAARALLPDWLERGDGYLLHTASAAGLLTNIGTAPYSVTKHAVVGLAEWLSMTHGDAGVTFSCLCPMGVRTNMVAGRSGRVRRRRRDLARASSSPRTAPRRSSRVSPTSDS